ncbi:MAG TPA: hypothetical protein VEW28_07635 [Candidatus Kapabacteria bacterium]|nr:hypothetical protein [Candidatus Kapabacteria bacterium]
MMKFISILTCLVLVLAVIGCGPNVKIVKFDTKQEAFFKGDSVKLYWIVENADSVTLDGLPVAKDSGWKVVRFDTARTYVLRAKNGHSERENYMHVIQ